MALNLTVTSIGRSDLALAIALQDVLTITNIVLTDAETVGTLSDISLSSQLGGSIVATMTASGRCIGTGKIQVEGSDNGSSQYEAKTLALTYSRGGQTRVFAIYTSSIPFIYKVSDTTVLIAAGISIDDIQAQSITFSNVTLSFPPATNSALGSVKLATEDDIKLPTPDDPASPLVPTAWGVKNVLKNSLGSQVYDGYIEVKGLDVGTNFESITVNASSFTLKTWGTYDADWPREFDVDDFNYSSFTMGTVSGECIYCQNNPGGTKHVELVDSTTKTSIGYIQDDGYGSGYVIRLYEQPTVAISFRVIHSGYGNYSTVRDLHTDDLESKSIQAKSLNVGKERTISFNSDSFFLNNASKYQYKGIIETSLDYGTPTFKIAGVTINGEVSNRTISWTNDGRIYTLSTSDGTLQCSGGTPQTGSITFTEYGNIVATGAISSYGMDLSRSGLLGWAKLRVSKLNSSSATTAVIVDSFNITVTYQNNNTITVNYIGPSIRSSKFVEATCGENFFGNTNKGKIALKEMNGDTVTFSQSNLSESPLTDIPLLIKVY